MNTIGITLGDVTGIGPEVAFKAVARLLGEDDTTRYVMIGDRDVANWYCGLLGIEGDLADWNERERLESRLYLLSPETALLPPELSPGAPEAALAAVAWLTEGGIRCLSKEFDGLVTGPVSKESIIRTGRDFVGQTEFLSELAGGKRAAMMLVGHDDRGRWLRVALATTHVPLNRVSNSLDRDRVLQTIELAAGACAQLGLKRSRIAVCGLNPHAGEGGKIGLEEMEVIAPAVQLARGKGIECEGPFSADTLFHRVFLGEYEAVVAMYHDQGLVPLKMVAFDTGVNWTLGLPFIRTSPDHGTAYDLAGKGAANPGSMECAIRLARDLASRKQGATPA